ncbi:hypothetical protein Agabi119p4_8707 [Agaricus bisporus var. burnettii]|uniref:BTB domain-containing protein n=2 Tax=Agaricus bisporus TaxID=5341 RepID=A0A8H7EXG0_AGABI|nr:hypothetical protein Agabi119p4_8707 [Agaricus bisporus var. burnettii]
MFASPSEEGKDPDGMHDDQPISLPGVTIREFEALMDYLYLPPHARSRYNDIQQNMDFYRDLLSISHRFLFDDIFQYALQQLESIRGQVPVETRLLIGDAYGLKDWLSSAYESLLDRQKAITTDECKAMGFERVVAFLRAREFRYRERLQIAEENLERTREGHFSSDPSRSERTPSSNQTLLKMFLL